MLIGDGDKEYARSAELAILELFHLDQLFSTPLAVQLSRFRRFVPKTARPALAKSLA